MLKPLESVRLPCFADGLVSNLGDIFMSALYLVIPEWVQLRVCSQPSGPLGLSVLPGAPFLDCFSVKCMAGPSFLFLLLIS